MGTVGTSRILKRTDICVLHPSIKLLAASDFTVAIRKQICLFYLAHKCFSHFRKKGLLLIEIVSLDQEKHFHHSAVIRRCQKFNVNTFLERHIKCKHFCLMVNHIQTGLFTGTEERGGHSSPSLRHFKNIETMTKR